MSTAYRRIKEALDRRLSSHNIFILDTSERYKELLMVECSHATIKHSQLQSLCEKINIHYFPPPKGFETWRPSICPKIISVAYWHPNNDDEYIAIVSNNSILKYNAKNGIFDPNDFFEKHFPGDKKAYLTFVDKFRNRNCPDDPIGSGKVPMPSLYPNLSWKKRNLIQTNEFTTNRIAFSDTLGETCGKKIGALDEYSVRLLNAMCGIHVPYVDGICRNCFDAYLPKIGFGISYINKKDKQSEIHLCEIRVSPPKLDGKFAPSNICTYVTSRYRIHNQDVWVRWEQVNTGSSLDLLPNFITEVNRSGTHNYWILEDCNLANESIKSEYFQKKIQQLDNITKEKNKFYIQLCQCK
ncbi:MAG: hypothetical protein ChlgKO_07340 [Chlamydiales bacterium]